jgi:peptide/nickel transport system substrate-binding protein
VTRRGRHPGQWRALVGILGVALFAAACGGGSGGSTTVTYIGVAGGTISFGTTESPTGCNPNTPAGDAPGTLSLLGAVLPSPFVVGDTGAPVANPNLIAQSELVSTKPETIVYTLNPKAVWSDGVPITATDFKYAWEQQRADAAFIPSVSSVAGYRDIASVTGSNGGHTVTVKFKTTFADWQMLFANLLPAHVMEKTGWNPTCTTVSPSIDLSGGPFMLHAVTPDTITLVQNPKWWGTPPNAKQITVHIASSTDQLAQWMTSGFVQVAQPSVLTSTFLTQMSGLPDAQSDVDFSDTLLQLNMASSPDTTLSPDVRVAVALLVNRQDLVDQQVGWALPGVQVADSHVNVQGQAAYKPASTASPTTTVPAPTSSTSTTVIGAGGSVNFPVTPVPAQADALLAADGLERAPGDPYYHYAFGIPFTLHMVVDAGDPWAARAALIIRAELVAAGLNTTLYGEPGATEAGQALSDGYADMALMPETFSPYLSQTLAWYTTLLGPPGRNGSADWTGYSSAQFDQTVTTASQQLNPDTAALSYAQADTMLWDEMVSLPLYPEPSALVWSRKIGGVTPTPRSDSLLWYAQFWAVRQAESTSNTTPSLPGQ